MQVKTTIALMFILLTTGYENPVKAEVQALKTATDLQCKIGPSGPIFLDCVSYPINMCHV